VASIVGREVHLLCSGAERAVTRWPGNKPCEGYKIFHGSHRCGTLGARKCRGCNDTEFDLEGAVDDETSMSIRRTALFRFREFHRLVWPERVCEFGRRRNIHPRYNHERSVHTRALHPHHVLRLLQERTLHDQTSLVSCTRHSVWNVVHAPSSRCCSPRPRRRPAACSSSRSRAGRCSRPSLPCP
jgi:hypothetical protein